MLDNDWDMAESPLVPGHEVVGTIAAGRREHVQTPRTRAAGRPGLACGLLHDVPVLHGRRPQPLCCESQGTIVGRHGGFADRVRAQAASVVPLPDGIDMASAGPLFCGGITVFTPLVAVRRQADRQGRGDRHRRAGPHGTAVPQRLGLRGDGLYLERSQEGRGPGNGRPSRHQLARSRADRGGGRTVRPHPVDGQRQARLERLLGALDAQGSFALRRRDPRAAGSRGLSPDHGATIRFGLARSEAPR